MFFSAITSLTTTNNIFFYLFFNPLMVRLSKSLKIGNLITYNNILRDDLNIIIWIYSFNNARILRFSFFTFGYNKYISKWS